MRLWAIGGVLGTGLVATIAPSVASAATAVPAGVSAPIYYNHPTPANLFQDAGEPSIGVDTATGMVMLQASQHTLQVSFDDSKSPPGSTWVDRTPPISPLTLDPILFTDQGTNRTFTSQLLILCSLAFHSDNDGTSWTGPTQGCSLSPPEDHQTVGGGPYHQPAPIGSGLLYPNAVYYCHQDGLVGNVTADGTAAYCGRSDTGSITYGPGVPIYTGFQCGGLHGHVKVGPDGTVYVPNQGCDGATFDNSINGFVYTHQSVVVSEDNGMTWAVRSIPDSKAVPYSDPSVGISRGNAVYFGYQDGGNTNRHPKIAVSHDHGSTWSPSVDVGTPLGIQNVEFPEVVAGDDSRAAFAFLGTTTAGDDQAADFYAVWHLYVSMTYDGGATWSTQDVTPSDPVQRGCITLIFPTSFCPTRNLLDFNDMTVDKQGRVLVAYADGCTAACVTSANKADNKYTTVGTIARQACGRGLYAAYDATLPACHAAAPGPVALTTGGGMPGTMAAPRSPGIVAGLAGAIVLLVVIAAGPGLRRRDG
jgi:hypothetical protein